MYSLRIHYKPQTITDTLNTGDWDDVVWYLFPGCLTCELHNLTLFFFFCVEQTAFAKYNTGPVLLVDSIFSTWHSSLWSVQVLSGCAIIVRGQPRGGPPPERQINLSNVRAGTMARRAAQGQPDTKDTPDEVSPIVLVFVDVYVCLAKAEQGPAK